MKTEFDKFKILEKYEDQQKLLYRELIHKFDYGSFHHFHDSFKEKVNDGYKSFDDTMTSLIMSTVAINSNPPMSSGTIFHMLVNHQDIAKSTFRTLSNLLNKENYLLNINLMANEWFNHAKGLGIDTSEEESNLEKLSELLSVFDKFKQSESYIEDVEDNLKSLIEIIKYDTSKEYKRRFNTLSELLSEDEMAKNMWDIRIHSNNKYIDNPTFLSETFKLDEIKEFIETNILNSIQAKIKAVEPSYLNTDAENFMSEIIQDSDVKSFLHNKSFEDKIDFKINMSKGQTYQEVIVFNDESILVKDSKDNYKTLLSDKDDIIKESKNIYKDYIAFKLRKKPKVSEFFKKLLIDEQYNIVGSILAINTFLNNEDILKNENFKLSDYYRRSLEAIDDEMNQIIDKFKLKQYAHSITSSKYMHLYSDESYNLFKSIKETGIDSSKVQEMIGKKIAAFHTPEEFNVALKKLINSINDFSIESVSLKAKGLGIKVYEHSEDITVLKINNFEQSKGLGSPSWCISRDEHYFTNYTSDNAQQFFIYDFSKDSKDNFSMIGLTLTSTGNYSTAHIKNDNSLRLNDFLKEIQYKLVYENPEFFINLDSTLKETARLHFNPVIEENITQDLKDSHVTKMKLGML